MPRQTSVPFTGCAEGRVSGANAKFCQPHKLIVDQLRTSAKSKEDKSFAELLKDIPRLSEAVSERLKDNLQLLQRHSRGAPVDRTTIRETDLARASLRNENWAET
eukprot:7761540-Alexandrium_andersonii.AAC.1